MPTPLRGDMPTSQCSVAVIGQRFWEQLSSTGRFLPSPPRDATETYWALVMGQAFCFFAPGTQQWKRPSLCSWSSHSNLSNLFLHGLQPWKPCVTIHRAVRSRGNGHASWPCESELWKKLRHLLKSAVCINYCNVFLTSAFISFSKTRNQDVWI